ncbi:MAG: hypothetical protein AB9866_03135 [Syntrophobacteraceae bacterium]
MKKTILICVALLLLAPLICIIGKGSACAVGDQDMGFPIYPGAKQAPANPAVNAPHLKNIHVFSSDPFDKVVAWYSHKLGKFDIDRQAKGTQALWHKETDDGFFMNVTISTLTAPPGQVEITLNKMKMLE